MNQNNNLQDLDFDDWDIDIEEIITHYARRGDAEVVQILREAVDTYKQDITDGDYYPPPPVSDSSSDDDDTDTVMERLHIQVNPDGFHELK